MSSAPTNLKFYKVLQWDVEVIPRANKFITSSTFSRKFNLKVMIKNSDIRKRNKKNNRKNQTKFRK